MASGFTKDGFVVQTDEREWEFTITARWSHDATLDDMQTALTNAYASAFAELTKRVEAGLAKGQAS